MHQSKLSNQAKDGTVYFVKRNGVDFFLFLCGSRSSSGDGSTHTTRVPQVISVGKTSEVSFLVLEYLNLVAGTTKDKRNLANNWQNCIESSSHVLAGTKQLHWATPQPGKPKTGSIFTAIIA